ncbi:MAG: hypothetical protein ABSH06_23805 [Thermodesulfobacteriota bacterium]|jgi:hypothetical protein
MAKFVKRPYNDFIHGGNGSQVEFFTLEKAKTVILHVVDCSVLVKDISRKADGTFTGIVWGFEPPAMVLRDLKINDSVTFTEDEVFSARKQD